VRPVALAPDVAGLPLSEDPWRLRQLRQRADRAGQQRVQHRVRDLPGATARRSPRSGTATRSSPATPFPGRPPGLAAWTCPAAASACAAGQATSQRLCKGRAGPARARRVLTIQIFYALGL
jgi:hypothetical protein